MAGVQHQCRDCKPMKSRDKEVSWLNAETGGTATVNRTDKARMASDKAVRDHIHRLSLEAKSERTMYERELMLARLEKAIGVPLLEVTAQQLYDWRSGLKVANSTAANYISHVQMFYRWAAREGLIKEDPSLDIPVPALPSRLPRPIAEADLMAALAATDTKAARVRLCLVLAAWVGLRAKEIRLLRVDNIRVNDDPPQIIVASDATKGRTERYVDLSPFVIAEIRRYDLPSSGLAFLKNGKPLRSWDVSRECNQFLHDHGIADTLHSLRHRFGTEAYAFERDIVEVAALMGHASIETTRGYTKRNRARSAAIVAGLPVPGRQEAS
jgi:integrase/recombinase XerC